MNEAIATSIDRKRPWLWCLAALPAILPLFVLAHYHVNIVWNDAWDFADILVRAHRGILSFSDFWAPHNEHRIPVPYLIMFVLARLTHWNTMAESLFGYAVVWCLSLLLAMLLKTTASDRGGPSRIWYWFLLNMLIFSPIQCENWVFGFASCADFIPIPCIVGAMLLLDRRGLGWPTLLLSAMLIEIASLSLANGLVGWVLILLLILTMSPARPADRKKRFIIAWIGMMLAGLIVQFRGYHSYAWAAKYYQSGLWNRILFYFAFIGNPLAPGLLYLIVPIGLVLTLIFSWNAFRTTRAWLHGDMQWVRRAMPWLLLGAYAIAGALLGAAGRAGLGLDQAQTTRYTTISLCLLICFVGLIHISSPQTRFRVFASPLFGVMLIIALVIGAFRSRELYFRQMYICRLAMAHLSFIDFLLEPHGQRLIGQYDNLRERADALSETGYLQLRLIKNPDIRALVPAGADTPEARSANGEIKGARQAAGGVVDLLGWAVLRDRHRGADVALITYDDENNMPRLCAIANIDIKVTEIAVSQGSEYELSGWRAQFPVARLPAGVHKLRFWGYDAQSQLAYPLAGPAVEIESQ